MLDCYYNSKAGMVGMDVLDPRDQPDHRDQSDPMDVMDSRDQLDLLAQRGKREIEEYSYEGLLDCKVQVVLDNYQGELVYTVPVIQTMYVLTYMCNVDLHVNCV